MLVKGNRLKGAPGFLISKIADHLAPGITSTSCVTKAITLLSEYRVRAAPVVRRSSNGNALELHSA